MADLDAMVDMATPAGETVPTLSGVPMGALADASGTTFGTWAPFAAAVSVAGPFNGWSPGATPLAPGPGGTWSARVPGVTPSTAYKFVMQQGTDLLWRLDPYARGTSADGTNAVIVSGDFTWRTDGYGAPSWDDLVVYELHLGTFNPDANGTGTIVTAAAKLDNLADLGISAVEIMPVAQFSTSTSWGYNTAYAYALESAYGSLNDFKRFVDSAHARGIAVIVDVVYNHAGPGGDLWRYDGWSEGPYGGIYFYQDWRAQTPWASRYDYGRPEVRAYILNSAMMLLAECRVDGLRLDATHYIRNAHGNDGDPGSDLPDGIALLQALNDGVDRSQPWKIVIAEDVGTNPWVTRPTAQDGAGFDAQWDNPGFLIPVRAAVTATRDEDRSMFAVRDALVNTYGGDSLRRVVFTESHDADANGGRRLPSEIALTDAASWWARKRSTLAAGIVLTAPAIPMLFQGQEFLADAWFEDGIPLNWNRQTTYSGIWAFYRDLIALRRNRSGTTRGLRGQNFNVFHVNDADKVIAYHRWQDGGPGDDVVVLANFANRSYVSYTIGFPRSGSWRVRLNSDWDGYGNGMYAGTPVYDTTAADPPLHGLPSSGSLGIGPYTIVVLSQGAP